jgi:hypothetical protein
MLLLDLVGCTRVPKDSQIVQRFNENQIVLSQLRDKLIQEPPRIVGFTKDQVMIDNPHNWISPEQAEVSPSHFLEY